MPAATASTLLVIGAGGHGRVVADAALAQDTWGRVAATDRDPARIGGDLLPGLRVQILQDALAGASAVHVAIGDGRARQREAEALHLPLATVIHPAATVSPHAHIGAGCFLAAASVVAPGARLGVCVILNHGAVADHDVQVGDFTHIAPLVALGGAVRIGVRVLVGAGAQVLPGLRVADDVVIGAGSVVRADIDTAGVYAGVPARRIG